MKKTVEKAKKKKHEKISLWTTVKVTVTCSVSKFRE